MMTEVVKQEELEDASLKEGAERFKKKVAQAIKDGRTSLVGPGKKLVVEGIDPLSKAIEHFLEEANAPGKRGRKAKLVKWVEEVGAETLAFLTLSVALDGIALKRPVVGVARALGTRIVDEAKFRRLKEAQPHLHDFRQKRAARSARYEKGREKLLAGVSYAEERGKLTTADLSMSEEDKLYVGIKLIDLLIASTGLFEIGTGTVRRKGGVTQDRWLLATPDAIEWMRSRMASMELLWPVLMPMVEEPLEWAPGQAGGYRYALKGKHSLVRRTKGEFRRKLDKLEMPVVYRSLNALQSTRWRINRDVLCLITEMKDHGVSLAGVPSFDLEKFPAKPHDIAVNPEAKTEWKRQMEEVYTANAKRGSAIVSFLKVFNIADKLKDAPAIFFPHNLDFRGRIYPLSSYLSPQGDDLSKGLLTFADAKPVGAAGARWLAVHGANCLDEFGGRKIGRMTLQERIELIDSLTPRILDTTDAPFSDLWWTEADKPLCFYAFCREWARYVRAGRSEGFCSDLPIAQDGTCNGLQHLAAMFLDEVGGQAVNVLPTAQPRDVYSDISERALDLLETMAAGGDPIAAKWITSGLVNRKHCKRPTMTFSYGSKQYGFRQQILEELNGRPDIEQIEAHFGTTEMTNEKGDVVTVPALGTAAGILAGVIWDALGEVVVAAPQAMEWFQKVAGVIVKDGQPVEWTVPGTGLPVRQEYRRSEKRQITTSLCGTAYKPAVYHELDELNFHKQRNAVAPNIVHSLDAAALMLTVAQARSAGITHFAMIHDSYGTVAGDSALLADILRGAFIHLYASHDVPAELAAEWAQTVDSDTARDMLAPPEKGTLDLELVRQSVYFFN